MADALKNATQQAQQGTAEGTNKWDAMSDEQKKATFNALPEDQKRGKSYMEWIKEGYQNQYENWMPWIEDQYLKWFTRDNKASYATKDTLDKSKVTGVSQVDNLQDGVNNLVAGQVGQGGLLQPVGDAVSKDGINRAERQGKDEKGSYGIGGPASTVTDPVVKNTKAGAEGVTGAVQGAGSYVGGLFGGGRKEEAK
ncbi:unnamed protein product [Zymoseptoria tritici ST99CH_3D1]|uniref:Uncharacterized protein n=3 Tax=Zymoseptoria tritici TaxID=1047171 RepID=A0A1X7RFP6_ZYMT9|nr:unnamed protein product [Zymoseptoria tritici ST99CH_3D7]SMR42590.1 unnamed protein product [Zymoseptoria tritici ST99CH_1E4]SMR44765.1 unnamed protein product [Zymoseptoria tritici ST99CH_3D1]